MRMYTKYCDYFGFDDTELQGMWIGLFITVGVLISIISEFMTCTL